MFPNCKQHPCMTNSGSTVQGLIVSDDLGKTLSRDFARQNLEANFRN